MSMRKRNIGACVSLMGCVALPLLTSCGSADRAIDTVQSAVNVLATQSEEWQGTMKTLERDLTAQGRLAIAKDVTQLEERGIATTGAELRCNAQLVHDQMLAGLEGILAKLQHKPVPAVGQSFCQVVPKQIDLSMPPRLREDLDFYGYNLDVARVRIFVVDRQGKTRAVTEKNVVATPTHYLMTVNISDTDGIQFTPNDRQLVFKLNDGSEHAVNIVAQSRKFFISPGPPQSKDGGGLGTSGKNFSEECTKGLVVTGLIGRGGGSVDQIEMRCSPLYADGALGAYESGPVHGGGGGGPKAALCTAGVLVGISGDGEGYNKGGVSRLGGQCASVESVANATASVTAVGGDWGYWGGGHFENACDPGYAVTGIAGRADSILRKISFICRRIVSGPASSEDETPCTAGRSRIAAGDRVTQRIPKQGERGPKFLTAQRAVQ